MWVLMLAPQREGLFCGVWVLLLNVCVTCVGYCAATPRSMQMDVPGNSMWYPMSNRSLILIPDSVGLCLSLKRHLQLHGGVSLTYVRNLPSRSGDVNMKILCSESSTSSNEQQWQQ